MKKLINFVPNYDVVMHHQVREGEHAVLLAAGGHYSVCQTQPERMLATAPNYDAGGRGLLSAPLSAKGLAHLLQWVDRNTALARFREMAGLPHHGLRLHNDEASG